MIEIHLLQTVTPISVLIRNNYVIFYIFLRETRMRFHFMLSSLSVYDFLKISQKQTTRASNFKIFHNVAHDSPYISTGSDVTIYFRSAANRKTCHFGVMFRPRFLDNGSAVFKKVYSFGKGDSSTSSFIV